MATRRRWRGEIYIKSRVVRLGWFHKEEHAAAEVAEATRIKFMLGDSASAAAIKRELLRTKMEKILQAGKLGVS